MPVRGKRRWPATAFSRFVRQKRLDLKKSQADVAGTLHMNQSYVSQLERGRPPSRTVDFIHAYADALETSSDVLWDLLGVSAGNRYSASSVSDLKPTVQGLARLTEDLHTEQIRLLEVMAREMAASNERDAAGAPRHTSAATTAPEHDADLAR